MQAIYFLPFHFFSTLSFSFLFIFFWSKNSDEFSVISLQHPEKGRFWKKKENKRHICFLTIISTLDSPMTMRMLLLRIEQRRIFLLLRIYIVNRKKVGRRIKYFIHKLRNRPTSNFRHDRTRWLPVNSASSINLCIIIT